MLLTATCCIGPCLRAQTPVTLQDYRRQVLEYSYRLKQAAENAEAAYQSARGLHTGFLPQLSADGDFSIHFKNRYGTQDGQEKLLRPYSFSLQPAVVQQIYGGGSVRNGYRQALVGYDMATLEQQLTELDVTYLAEYNYWNLASNAALLEATVRYEQIVRTMYDVIRTRFEDGYVAKNDLLMIQTRLRSAEFYRIQVENLYRVALQNFNVLSGVEPDMPRRIADSITEPSPLPQLASARFMPRLSAGVQGVWNSLSPNFSGETEVDGLTFLRLSVPIFHWGERRRAVAVSQAAFRSAQYAERQKVDDLTLAISSAWTNITEAAIQIEIAQANLDVAGENLSLNTFSYNEGQLAVLDVISSQISWIQAYTNVITAHFNEKVAISAYRKAANIRP